MINLRIRTEYSFGTAYGPLAKVIDAVGDAPALGITDRASTWGHVAFEKACKKAGKKAILGVELATVAELVQDRSPINYTGFIARTDAGLREIYELVTEATAPENFYMVPRIPYKRLQAVSQDVAILSGVNPRWDLLPEGQSNLFIELAPGSSNVPLTFPHRYGSLIATSDNYYPRPEHQQVYEMVTGRNRDSRTAPMWILDRWEYDSIWGSVTTSPRACANALASECNATVPRAEMVKFPSDKSLEQICREVARSRSVNLGDPVYSQRLNRELTLIEEKGFTDYFHVISDMLRYAKQHMLVGPARGSSCGSLVCYLLSITEIDPIPYGLLFERFIDINRKDFPDIDIDFPDNRREMVFEYCRQRYGVEAVARLGTVMRYKAKSAIDAVAIPFRVARIDSELLKSVVIERDDGDARAAFCIADSFEQVQVAKDLLVKYPHLKIATQVEMHARTSGQHAAGIVITNKPLKNFCSFNQRTGAVMLDMRDAETVGLLKIDALGLRTLSVIQECLDQIGQTREWLLALPTDDQAAFEVANASRFAGIFQFEGQALQNLCQQMKVEGFEDIASLGALARPGPLNSGASMEFVRRRTGKALPTPLHPSIAHLTKITYGVVIYQETVMQICREMGQLSWEDVTAVRKAMGKSLGRETFNHYWEKFLEGAKKNGVTEEDATRVWDSLCTMGAYGFNRSHAVAYGMVTYWCLYLKAHYPLEWAVSCLRNSGSDEQTVKLLRELDSEGYKYSVFDIDLSEENWAVKNNRLIGGLLNLTGVGPAKAKEILEKRAAGKKLSPAMSKKLAEAKSPFAPETVFECRYRWGHILADPAKYNIRSKLWRLSDITSDMNGTFVFLARIAEAEVRDINDPYLLARRGGERKDGQPYFLNLLVEDDSGDIRLSINCRSYLELGLPIVKGPKGGIGRWFLWRGEMRPGFRKVWVERYWDEDHLARLI